MSSKEYIFQQHAAFLADGAAGGPEIRALRDDALTAFQALGFPTTRDEEWRFTNMAPAITQEFTLAQPGAVHVTDEQIRECCLPSLQGTRLVFINGHYAPKLSDHKLPEGLRFLPLAQAIAQADPLMHQHLGKYAPHARQTFTAINTAFVHDGALLQIERGVVLSEPIHIVFYSQPAAQQTVSYPRLLIVAEPNSQSTIIEDYAGPEGSVYFTNAVTEVVAGEYSVTDHYRVQRESQSAFHVGALQVYQERSSSFSSHSLSFGAAICRNNTGTVLDGVGAEGILNGLYITTGEQLVDNHMYVDHAKPHCESHELYKGVLKGRSRGVFNGRIMVRADAQKTNAKQTNKNLLFDQALANSNPQLEIFADDVKCTHGSTTGRLDDDSMFYLRSRGISEKDARDLLTYAFAYDVVSRIKVEPLRLELERHLLATHNVPAHLEVV